MNTNLSINEMKVSFRKSIKLYLKRAQEIEAYLTRKPEEWGRFQSEFNSEVDGVFRNVMNFEKANLAEGNEERVYKLRQIFIKRFKLLFSKGVYCEWSILKPYGYSGDFKIIDYIYQNNPTTTGFDRLFDNYYQMTAISVGVRNRKNDFRQKLL